MRLLRHTLDAARCASAVQKSGERSSTVSILKFSSMKALISALHASILFLGPLIITIVTAFFSLDFSLRSTSIVTLCSVVFSAAQQPFAKLLCCHQPPSDMAVSTRYCGVHLQCT